jgi:hypothetical protein
MHDACGFAAPPSSPRRTRAAARSARMASASASSPPPPPPPQRPPAPPPLRVLAYGDSLTAGYHASGWAFHPYARRLSSLLRGAPVRARAPARIHTRLRQRRRQTTTE